MKDDIILYTIGCSSCNMLAGMLEDKGIEFTTINDEDKIREAGFTVLPILTINGKVYGFTDAIRYIKNI